ncbi:hypothetical protein [Deinococcus sp.]|uniref:hypothetical protein n=1 Tax=Deinococcus sp. TaxID=47478 RepID=UPI00286DDE2C|nr:hypothetical protein [Deinococcus sp.]
MNDRILDALVAAGIDTTPLSLLDHASAQTSTFFALYDQELVYLESGKSSRVALRDVTRIHSDREGVLRVETSAHTAVTASLLGYDPGRVQTFFQQVRDVTARSKELPVLPLSSKPAESASSAGLPGFGKPAASLSSTSMPGVSAYTPSPESVTVPPAAPVVIAPVAQPVSVQPAPAQSSPAQPTPAQPAATSQMPTPAQDAVGENVPGVTLTAPPTPVTSGPSSSALPSPAVPAPGAAFMPAGAIRAAVPRPEPVIISSMPPVSALPAFQERAGERNRQAIRAAPVAEAAVSQSTGQLTRVQSTKTQVSEVRTAELPVVAHTQGPLVSVPAASAGQDAGLRSELLRRADSVGALASTVGLLAVVLGLAALALAFFQWSGNAGLSAIWTLLTGGVGTVALLAFAEALRLLSALARSQQA